MSTELPARDRHTRRVLLADGKGVLWGDELWEDSDFHRRLAAYLLSQDDVESLRQAQEHLELTRRRSGFEAMEDAGISVDAPERLGLPAPSTPEETQALAFLQIEVLEWIGAGSRPRRKPFYVTDHRAPIMQARHEVNQLFFDLIAAGASLEEAQDPVRALVLNLARQLQEARELIATLEAERED